MGASALTLSTGMRIRRRMATVKGGIFSSLIFLLILPYCSFESGAQWCFVGAGSTCTDIQTTQQGPYTKEWSYEACATPAETTPTPAGNTHISLLAVF